MTTTKNELLNERTEEEEEVKANSNKERIFSLDLKSSDSLRYASIGDEKRGRKENPRVLIEGSIGMLNRVSFIDGMILEIQGTKGTLRVDLTNKELIQSLSFSSSQHGQQQKQQQQGERIAEN